MNETWFQVVHRLLHVTHHAFHVGQFHQIRGTVLPMGRFQLGHDHVRLPTGQHGVQHLPHVHAAVLSYCTLLHEPTVDNFMNHLKKINCRSITDQFQVTVNWEIKHNQTEPQTNQTQNIFSTNEHLWKREALTSLNKQCLQSNLIWCSSPEVAILQKTSPKMANLKRRSIMNILKRRLQNWRPPNGHSKMTSPKLAILNCPPQNGLTSPKIAILE